MIKVNSEISSIEFDDNYCLNMKRQSIRARESSATFRFLEGYKNSYTIEFDIFLRNVLNGSPLLVSEMLNLQLQDDRIIVFMPKSGGGTLEKRRYNVTLNSWQKVIISYASGVGMKLFLDESLGYDFSGFTQDNKFTSTPLRFNWTTSGGPIIDGQVRNMRFTMDSGLISDADAAEIYNNNKFLDKSAHSFFTGKTVYQYRMNQKQGKCIIDSGGTETHQKMLPVNQFNQLKGGDVWTPQAA